MEATGDIQRFVKFTLNHRHHQPSPAFIALIRQRFEALREDLQIDEVQVLVERRLEANPAFRVAAHLTTPGPDVFAEAVDHTLRAALEKLIGQLETRVDRRPQKRARHEPASRGEISPAKPGSGSARI